MNLTAETLRATLSYDKVTGAFRWLNCKKSYLNGSLAGCINSSGYLVIRIEGTLYYGHRLAWLYETGEWPEFEIDHEDLRKSNNIFGNLRPATHLENLKNTKIRSTNKSGYKGVYFNNRQQQWHATITISGKSVHLGYFDDIDEAATKYAKASNDLHGAFGRVA